MKKVRKSGSPEAGKPVRIVTICGFFQSIGLPDFFAI